MALPNRLRRPSFGELASEVAGFDQAELAAALSEQASQGGRLGQILCRRGSLSREQLRRVLALQARRVAALASGTGNCFPIPGFLSVCMPAFNERLNIEDTLDAACAILPEFVDRFEVVVVDDGSTDATEEAVERAAAHDRRIRLVRHAVNRGYGAAVTSGLRAARGDLIFFTDSDGQFSLLNLAEFLLELRTRDAVIGYRYDRAETGMRRCNAWAWNLLIRMVLGVRVRDLDCAFKLFRRQVIDQMHLSASGAAISAEIMSQVLRGGWRVRELPVEHFPRCHGQPTGAALKVIARAFRELPDLWRRRPVQAPQAIAAAAEAPYPPPVPAFHAAFEDHSVMTRQTSSSRDRDATRLKICMLAACPFPANHGTPGSIREMAEAICDRGHDVHLVTYHMGENIPVTGPRIHRVPPLTSESSIVVGPTVRRPLYDLQMVFKAIEVVRQYDIDLIHSHGYEAGLIAWLARMVTGLPIVSSAHNTMSDELPTYQFIRPRWLAAGIGGVLDAFVPRIANRTIPHSANIERFYRRRGLARRTERVIYKGIKLDGTKRSDGARVRQQYELGRGPVLLYAGVMNEFQRLDLLLEAMAQVTWVEPNARLLFVVTIPSERHLSHVRQQAERLGLSGKVTFTTPQALDHLPEYLAACDVAIVPRPQSPGFPIKILNYMAAGKPCVLFKSSAGGLTHRVNAYLVPHDTAVALAEGILELLRDPDLRSEMARRAIDFVRRHRDRRVTARGVCAAYGRVLNGSLRPPVAAPAARDMAEAVLPDSSERQWPADAPEFTITESSPEMLCEAAIEPLA